MKYKDTETDEVLTEDRLKAEYHELKAARCTETNSYEEYISSCLDKGTLIEFNEKQYIMEQLAGCYDDNAWLASIMRTHMDKMMANYYNDDKLQKWEDFEWTVSFAGVSITLSNCAAVYNGIDEMLKEVAEE